MKKNIFTLVIIIIGNFANAQINLPSVPNVSIIGEHAFIDASDYGINWGSNESKGINFPQTDLTTWVFKTDFLNGMQFSTAYDGMVVYNIGTGSTLATDLFGNGQTLSKANNGIVTTVTPGFYYFYNPMLPMTSSTEIVENGKWLPLGTGSSGLIIVPVKNYSTTEIATSTSIDGKQVYAIKGAFHAGGINALVTIDKPLGMTGYYKMTTYQSGMTFRTGISSFNIDPLVTTNNVVTGSGFFNEVYPAGDYTYTLEYFK
jgi:hypothetical protein